MGVITDYNGLIYWCLLIFLISFFVGMQWVVVRVLLPMHRLTQAARTIVSGELPTFNQSMGGIGEIDQLRRSLQHMTTQIRLAQEREALYRSALTDSQENERKRIAREIHDDTIQSLVLVSHSLDRAGQTLPAETPSLAHLQAGRQQIVHVIDGLRQMISYLRPTVLDELGLVAAIEILCDSNPTLVYQVMGEVYALDHTQELVIFRAAQEAIRNAQNHAQADHISVTVTYLPTGVTLTVTDDGVGFRIPQHLQEFAARGHYGLMGIRERVLYVRGRFHLTSDGTSGTQVMIHLTR